MLKRRILYVSVFFKTKKFGFLYFLKLKWPILLAPLKLSGPSFIPVCVWDPTGSQFFVLVVFDKRSRKLKGSLVKFVDVF